MNQTLKCLATCGIMLLSGIGSLAAQDKEGEESAAFPVELYICNYNDGKGPADLDMWAEKWNAWADSSGPESYSAWTLTPFYYGGDQDFDFIWLGTSPDATTLGRAYDNYLSNSGSLNPEFMAIADCGTHNNFATINIKQPPDDGDSDSFVLSFSDCKIAEGKTFDDVYPALTAWTEYRAGHGSEAGMWVMWPAYGGGAVKYDFKFAVSHPNYESQGADWDAYAKGGYAKAEELFGGLMDCDVARAYNASMRRDGRPSDE